MEVINIGKKKTHEEYVNELATNFPDIEVVEPYTNALTKIKHHCKKHNIYWDVTPANILSGKGCKMCAKEKFHQKKAKTHEEYVKEIAIKNPNIEVVGEYKGADIKILHHCRTHDIYWEVKPSNILHGQGCKLCGKEKFRKKTTRTHEQYVAQLKEENPNIEVIDTFITCTTPIKHHCKIHDVYWDVIPDNVLRSHGCPKCRGEKITNKLSKTHNEYVNELKAINPNIKVIEQYNGANATIKHKCLIDGYEWYTTPANILYGKGCPKCGGNYRRTQDDYINELKNINPDIEVIGQYTKVTDPIEHRCKIHNIKWITSPASMLQGCGCAECAKEKLSIANKKTHDQYVRDLKNKNPNIIVKEQYNGANIPILHRCLIDGYEWKGIPGNILFGEGCPKCAGNVRRTTQEYIEELHNINPEIKVLAEFINMKTPILHKCLIDGYIWETTPMSTLQGNGCPQCNESSGERKIRQWLEDHMLNYTYQKTFDDCKDKHVLPFDFYIPRFNTCIEYDGKQHYQPIEYFGGEKSFNKTVKHDNIKNEYCKNNGISLLRIPYYKNVEEELNNFLFI